MKLNQIPITEIARGRMDKTYKYIVCISVHTICAYGQKMFKISPARTKNNQYLCQHTEHISIIELC